MDLPSAAAGERLSREAAQIARTTRLGLSANLGLCVLKLVVGKVTGSIALIADGFNSLTDVVTDVAVLVGTAVGGRPADRTHPYGHGKFETFVAGLVSLGVLGVGVGIVASGIKGLIAPAEMPQGQWVIAVAVITMLVKELLYRRTYKVAELCRSASLQAKAWDHRSDVGVSLVVLAAGVGAVLRWQFADAVAGAVVGTLIALVGGKLLLGVLHELSEASAGEEVDARIQDLLRDVPEVRGWHRLRIRRLGRELIMDVHVMLDPDLTVRQSHEIVENIERRIAAALSWPVHLIIHVDPDTEDIRAARLAAGDPTLRNPSPQ